MKQQIVIAVSAIVLSGCANEMTVFRTTDLREAEAIITDASQRAIFTTKAKSDQNYFGRVEVGRITCAEPSPDVALAVSTAITAAFKAAASDTSGSSKDVSGAFGFATATSIAQLGERLGTIQLLRDELADLCRSYANGAVSATTYTLRLSKLDKKMVTLLATEASAGAFGRTLAAIGGSAGANSGAAATEDQIKEARQAVKDDATAFTKAQKDVDEKQNAIDDPKNTANVDKLKGELEGKKAIRDAALVRLNTDRAALLDLDRRSAQAFAAGNIIGLPGVIAGTHSSQLGEIALLQQQYMEADETGTLMDACLTAMDLKRIPTTEQQKSNLDAADRIDRRNSDLRQELADLQFAPSNETNTGKENRFQRVKRNSEELEANQLASITLRQSAAGDLSRLGQWCETKGMQQVIDTAKAAAQTRLARAQSEERRTGLAICAPILDGTRKDAPADLASYCKRLVKP